MRRWQEHTHIVGVDEVGRGPLAGPVTVAAVKVSVVNMAAAKKLLSGIRDSKQLTEQHREKWYRVVTSTPLIAYALTYVSAPVIDRDGITGAVRRALTRSLDKLTLDPERAHILLDGGLVAPSQFTSQETIVRGDAQEPLIAAASIIAKVHRDARMVRYARAYPQYGFERHKGYGTEVHRNAILEHGLSPLHRKSFCGSLALF